MAPHDRTVRTPTQGTAPIARRTRGAQVAGSVLIAVVLVAAVVLVGVGWIGSERAIHPVQSGELFALAGYPQLHPEEVNLAAPDGVPIAGSFFPGASRTTIILCHGYGGNRSEMLPRSAGHGPGT